MSKYTIPDIKKEPRGSVTSGLEPELSNQGFQGKNQQTPPVLRPRIACKVNIYKEQIILSQDGRDFGFQINERARETLQKLFLMMDGTRTISELEQIFSPNHPGAINTIVSHLDEQGLLDDATQLSIHSGIETLLTLESLINELFNNSINKNQFKNRINFATSDLPIKVVYGFVIEQYHFFSRKGYLFSPVLGFQSSKNVRQLMNELYCREYGQDELLIEALNAIGISREELAETMPLPETMALCNGLTYWANFEPLFFFSTLGVLADQTLNNFEIYLKACERFELGDRFMDPIRQLVTTKLKSEQENLTRRIFQEIVHIDKETKQRFRGQTYLFIEMYNNFHTAIWKHYSSTSNLLRRVSAI